MLEEDEAYAAERVSSMPSDCSFITTKYAAPETKPITAIIKIIIQSLLSAFFVTAHLIIAIKATVNYILIILFITKKVNTALKEGEALPSVRSLAGELRISALTVKKAYDKLEEEGFVTTIHGKGTYVTASDKQLALEARQREAEADFEKAIDRALAMGMSREDILETVTLLLEEK